ncbi:MAG: hypothetical protein LBJ99_01360 [Oscillospiraceae bacterium]|nr:hypothetical protein [Oscillospiraceae bacterium]
MGMIIAMVVITVVGGVGYGIYLIINNVYHGGAHDKNKGEQLRIAGEINSLVTKYDPSIKTDHLKTTSSSLNKSPPDNLMQLLYKVPSTWSQNFFDYWLFGRPAGKYRSGEEEFNPTASENKWIDEDIEKFYELKSAYVQYGQMASYHIGKYISGKGNATFKSAVARSGISGYSTQAKQELAAAQAKKDRNAIIKGAVVGGVVGGQAGAVVGAMAAKASNDAKNGASQSSGGSAAKSMVKGAVVGSIVGGDAGAVVGAMVAKEKHDSENKQ